MRSFYRWIFEHTGLCRVLLFFGLCGLAFFLSSFSYVSFLTVYLIVLGLWFLVGRFIANAPLKLFREPVEQLNHNCDPYPLMEETQRQLQRKFDGPHRQMMEFNHAAALRETGQFYKAMDILENLNIDKFPGTSPFSKYTYYHNLCDLCYVLDRKEEGRIWHRKANQIYEDLPPVKPKQELEATHALLEAEILYYDGNPDEALRKTAKIQLSHRKMILDAAFLAARCHIALEEPEKAREKLCYIMENGNRLHITEQAGELLESLN